MISSAIVFITCAAGLYCYAAMDKSLYLILVFGLIGLIPFMIISLIRGESEYQLHAAERKIREK